MSIKRMQSDSAYRRVFCKNTQKSTPICSAGECGVMYKIKKEFILKYLTILIILLTISGCENAQKSEIKTIYINHYQVECNGLVPRTCLESRTKETDQWQFLYSGISGFSYEWGYSYKLKIEITTIDNPPQDGSSLEYSLLELLEKNKEQVTSLFKIPLQEEGAISIIEPSNLYKIYNGKEFTCITFDCVTIESLITQNMAILFEFRHQEDPTMPLIVTQILCSSSRESFRASCL